MAEWYVELSDGTLQNTEDITDLSFVPELNLEDRKYGFYVNLRRSLENLSHAKQIEFVADQISRYKLAYQRRNPSGIPSCYTIDMLLSMRINELHKKLDEINKQSYQLEMPIER